MNHQLANQGENIESISTEFLGSCLNKLKENANLSDWYLIRKGYEVSQRNGQRISILSGQQPPEDDLCHEVFVGKLPRDLLEYELMPYLLKIGPVYKIRLMMDFSGYNRGYGFVVFINSSDASRACKLLNNFKIRPNSKFNIVVCPSINNKSLWLGNLPVHVPKEKLISELRKIVDGIEAVKLIVPGRRGSQYAIVKFESHEDATKARRVLCPGTARILNHKIKVDWAKPAKPNPCTTTTKTTTIATTTSSIPITTSTNHETFLQDSLRILSNRDCRLWTGLDLYRCLSAIRK